MASNEVLLMFGVVVAILYCIVEIMTTQFITKAQESELQRLGREFRSRLEQIKRLNPALFETLMNAPVVSRGTVLKYSLPEETDLHGSGLRREMIGALEVHSRFLEIAEKEVSSKGNMEVLCVFDQA